MKALFIGRFQPFHKGHLKVLQRVNDRYDLIIIGIGSSQYSNTRDNPFSLQERERMIKETLDETNINYRIIPIPDIHNPPMWVSHVVSIVKDFDVVISNNSFTTKLFTEKGYTVEETPYFEGYSGKDIRERITKGETWEDRVPQEVAKVIKNIDGVERIKKLSY